MFRIISQLPDSKGKEAASYVPFIYFGGNITHVCTLDHLHYLQRLLKMKHDLMSLFLTLMNCMLSFIIYGLFGLHYYMISYSGGALPSEEVADANADANKVDMKAKDSENDEYDKDDSGANHLSVMYLPCQDPLLFKMY